MAAFVKFAFFSKLCDKIVHLWIFPHSWYFLMADFFLGGGKICYFIESQQNSQFFMTSSRNINFPHCWFFECLFPPPKKNTLISLKFDKIHNYLLKYELFFFNLQFLGQIRYLDMWLQKIKIIWKFSPFLGWLIEHCNVTISGYFKKI